MTERMHALGGAPTWEEACQEWGIRFDAEAFKRVADDMVQEAGVELLLAHLGHRRRRSGRAKSRR